MGTNNPNMAEIDQLFASPLQAFPLAGEYKMERTVLGYFHSKI